MPLFLHIQKTLSYTEDKFKVILCMAYVQKNHNSSSVNKKKKKGINISMLRVDN